MPKLVDAAAQRRDIREAALRVFARRGVRGTGLGHVAEAAGMGRSSLYHYYRDKAALVRDVVRDLLAREEALFDAVAAGGGGALARLEMLGAALPGLFREWEAVGRLLIELRSSDARLFRRFFRRIRAALAALVAEGQRSGEIDAALDPAATAATLIGAIDGLLLQLLVEPGAFEDRDALFAGFLASTRKLLRP